VSVASPREKSVHGTTATLLIGAGISFGAAGVSKLRLMQPKAAPAK
jgi:hypothetical protein